MADAEEVFSAEGIRNFIISRGGRVKNVELVGHYKKYLNDPVKKAENRQKFKDFINAVAVVKVENDAQKTLVLKKKQQDWSSPKGPGSQDSLPRQRPFQAPPPPPQSSPRRTPSPKPRTRPPTTPPPPPPSDGTPPVNRPVPKPRQSKAKSSPASRPEISAPMLLQRPEPVPESAHQPGVEPMQTEPVYAELMKMGPERSRTPPPSNGVIRNGGGDPAAGGDGEYTYTGPKEQTSYVSPKEGERIIDAKSQISSVRDQASFFQEAAAQQAQELEAMQSPVRTPRKQRISLEDNDAGGTLKGDEELYATLALDPLEREWMVYASQGNVGGMCNLLTQDHTLCSKKDFITGFTALHWGAKLGKKEMIKLVADKGVDINMRSQGGYTALHIAALHHKEAVMQLLIQDYYANVDIRDYSGKKPKHYLKKGASAFIKRKLDPIPFETPSHNNHSTKPIATPGIETPSSDVISQTPKSGTSVTRVLSRMSFRKAQKKLRQRQENLAPIGND